MTLNQESGKQLGAGAVQVKHIRTSSNTGAFASFVNECEKGTRDLSSLFPVFFVCSSSLLTHLAEKYLAALNIAVRFLISKNHHIRLLIQHPFIHPFLNTNDISHILITSPKIKLSWERVK